MIQLQQPRAFHRRGHAAPYRRRLGGLCNFVAELEASPRSPGNIGAVSQWIVQVFAQNRGLLRAQLHRALDNPEIWRPYQNLARLVIEEVIRLLARYPELGADPDWQQHGASPCRWCSAC